MSSTQLSPDGLIVPCASCGQRNRIAFSARESRCGKCKEPLPMPSEPIEVPDAPSFDALVAGSPLPVVVDFWATWCGPCRMVAPEIARVAASNRGRLVVVKVDTDAVPDLAERYRIRSIPTMSVFKDGKQVGSTVGAMPAQQIEAFVSKSIGGA